MQFILNLHIWHCTRLHAYLQFSRWYSAYTKKNVCLVKLWLIATTFGMICIFQFLQYTSLKYIIFNPKKVCHECNEVHAWCSYAIYMHPYNILYYMNVFSDCACVYIIWQACMLSTWPLNVLSHNLCINEYDLIINYVRVWRGHACMLLGLKFPFVSFKLYKILLQPGCNNSVCGRNSDLLHLTRSKWFTVW